MGPLVIRRQGTTPQVLAVLNYRPATLRRKVPSCSETAAARSHQLWGGSVPSVPGHYLSQRRDPARVSSVITAEGPSRSRRRAGGAATSREAGVAAETGGRAGREVVPGARPRMLAAPAAAAALGAARGLGRSHQAPLGPFLGGGDVRSGRGLGRALPACAAWGERPPLGRPGRGGRRGGGAGASPGTVAGAALLDTSSPCSQPRPRCGVGGCGVGARAGAGAWREARAGSLPPPRRLSAAAAPQPGSGGSAPPRLPPLPQAGPGGAGRDSSGAESEDSGRLRLSMTYRLAWASPLPQLDAASSRLAWGCFSAGEAGITSYLGGALWGEEACARGLSSHPSCRRVLYQHWGRGTHSMRRVAVLYVLHPAHVVGCSLPSAPFLQLVRREVNGVVFPLWFPSCGVKGVRVSFLC